MTTTRQHFLAILGGFWLAVVVGLSGPVALSAAESGPKARLAAADEALTAGKFAEAEGLLRQVVKEAPQTPEADQARYRLGDALFYRTDLAVEDRYPLAIQAYKEALRRQPKSPLAEWALLQIANAYRLQGRFFMASTFYQRLGREFPEGRFAREAHFGRAETYYGIRQYALAHKLYLSFAERYPADKRVLLALAGAANSLYHQEKYSEAQAAYGRLLAHPSFAESSLEPEVRYPMAETCFRLQDYVCAKERFMEFYNLYPQHERGDEALARMGDVYVEEGQPTTALAFYQEVVALYPESDGAAISRIRMADLAVKHPEIAKRFRLLHADFDPMKVYSSVASSSAALPLAELALYKKAQLLSREGRHLEAIREFRRLRQKYPTGNLVEHSRAASVEALQRIVEARLRDQKSLEAIEIYLGHQSMVAGVDYQPYTLYRLVGQALLQQGLPLKAAELFRRIVEAEFPTPEDEEASWLLGKAYLEAGDLERAEGQFERFLERYPSSPHAGEARFSLAKSLFLRQRFVDAVRLFEAELRRGAKSPREAETLLLLARSQWALAKKDQALQTYRRLLSEDAEADSPRHGPRREAAYQVSDLLFELGAFPQALASYQEAIKRYPDDFRRSWAELQVGRALQHLGRHEEAKEAYQNLATQAESGSLWSLVAAEYRETVRPKKSN